MREIRVTPEEYDKLRWLDMECRYQVLLNPSKNSKGIFSGFDDVKWQKGVKEILEERAPPPDGQTTKITVLPS